MDPTLMVDVDGKDIKIVKTKLNSLRLDSLLKAGLGTAKKYYFSISIFLLINTHLFSNTAKWKLHSMRVE